MNRLAEARTLVAAMLLRMEGGSTVSLYMLDNDCLFGRNCKPPADDVGHCDFQTLPDLPGIPQPFDGNFIWIDVESVAPAPQTPVRSASSIR